MQRLKLLLPATLLVFMACSCTSTKKTLPPAAILSLAAVEEQREFAIPPQASNYAVSASIESPGLHVTPPSSTKTAGVSPNLKPEKTTAVKGHMAKTTLSEEEPTATARKKIEPWGLASVVAIGVSFILGFLPTYLVVGSGTIALSSFTTLFAIIAVIISLVRFKKYPGTYRGKALPFITLGILAAGLIGTIVIIFTMM